MLSLNVRTPVHENNHRSHRVQDPSLIRISQQSLCTPEFPGAGTGLFRFFNSVYDISFFWGTVFSFRGTLFYGLQAKCKL